MRRTNRNLGLAGLALATAGVLASCTMDNDDGHRRFTVTVENVGTPYPYFESGAFDTPEGATGPGPAFPGDHYEFTVHAGPGHRLSFATMMAQSNDFFYAPDGEGIALYDEDGMPRSGDVSDEVYLWDAGTELNQEPGAGPDQAPRQGAPETGAADPDTTVRMAPDDFGNLPDVTEVIQVVLTHEGDDTFTVTITNVSDASTLASSAGSAPVPLSPGVCVVHSGPDPLFTVGMPDRGAGLEHIAEDGNPTQLAAAVADDTGLVTPFAPGLWVVQTEPEAIFSPGSPDRGLGLEPLAEDGDPSTLAEALGAKIAGIFDGSGDGYEAGPLFPGSAYTFTLEARPGDRLFLATMLGQSNDVFAGTDGEGIALFATDGTARSGDVTASIQLWDTGTEVNQRPGSGSDQAPRQAGPDTGATEGGVVRPVDDGYAYPPVTSLLRVTITPAL